MATFACLGWGSLVWNRGGLPVRSTWFEDGPLVQVELIRQSRNGRITFVLDNETPPVRSLWAILDVDDMAAARNVLGAREGISEATRDKWIGSWAVGEEKLPGLVLDVSDWARLKDVDGVVWTALPPRFGEEQRRPSAAEVVNYLSSLTGESRVLAEEYIRKAPRQVATPYRHEIETALDWRST